MSDCQGSKNHSIILLNREERAPPGGYPGHLISRYTETGRRHKTSRIKTDNRTNGRRSRHQERMWSSQKYCVLRASCLEKGCLFTDPEFPPEVTDPAVEWRRPLEFCSNPKFIESGSSSSDVCQGELGDCWLLSTLSSLTLHPSLFSRVVPADQSFSTADGYCGIFHFKVWRFGDWLDVVVDDRLPTRKGRLVYTRSDSQAELWSALLEKAYAKVSGGYSALQGGTIAETLEDFTGGVAESVSLSRYTSEEVREMVLAAGRREALMACYIQVSEAADIGRVDEDGLVLGHAYSVLGAKEVKRGSEELTLIRLRNPWGFTEYNGPWSDQSLEWRSVSDAERRALNLQKEDGDFWMLCEDFCSLFSWIVICTCGMESSQCKVTEMRGRWERGVSAGGGRRLKSFFTNPQFRLRVGVASGVKVESVTEPGIEERWTMLLELMQTDRRATKHHIACHLYRVPEQLVPRPRLDRGFFTRSRPVSDTGEPQNSRGVTMRASLTPGEYVIVPSTYDLNQEGDFYIRVYCEKGTDDRIY
ncbi:calpain-1 catalytic subunit-like isoform X1 [Bufo gargarizans]|uniref:calpain-1 catalytic subunit-like isoform X1 n=1 Tax=Bufo gargarizans TaxID=30331 RepID=UPI001CF48E01|nr:calpain-1 catalytic subunit-like isoform X1 [Bufo gargarizans]